MTFACKEEYMVFEQLMQRQHQLYNDSADYGITYGEIDDLDSVRAALNEMLKVFKKPDYDYKVSDWGHGRTIQFFIPIEIDEGMEQGYQFQVAGFEDRKLSGGGALMINIFRTVRAPKFQS